MSELSENLKTIRLQWRRTQADMGHIFEVTRPVYQSYESGRNEPDIWFIFRMESLTGINARRLCFERLERLEIPDQPLFKASVNASQLDEPLVVYQKHSPTIAELWRCLQNLEERLVVLENKFG